MSDWWDEDPVHALGADIAADQRLGAGRYRLLARLPCLNCESKGRQTRTILAQYVGPGGTKWLWTPGYKGTVNHPVHTSDVADPVRLERIPPRAWAYHAGLFRIAACPGCRHGQPFHVTAQGIDLNFEAVAGTFTRVAEG